MSKDLSGGPSVVMVGISEALVATAVGLFVALPAVIAYNLIQRKIATKINNAEIIANEMTKLIKTQ